MTEIDNNDKLLKDFFNENKQEIADDGFSKRVVHHLPHRSNKSAYIQTAIIAIVGTVLFFRMGGLQAISKTFKEVFYNILQYQDINIDAKSLIIAAAVLLFIGTRKVASMA